MSTQARAALINSGQIVFRSEIQKLDFTNESPGAGLQTDCIALLTEICIVKKHIIVITAAMHDHSNDSCLGFHSHADGFCVDCWPLLDKTDPTSYVPSIGQMMDSFLADCARSVWLYQIGLAGSADSRANEIAAGRTEFTDDGADHIHLGAK
jgi:hypothetical protein